MEPSVTRFRCCEHNLRFLVLFLLLQYHIYGTRKQGVLLFHVIGNGTYYQLYFFLGEAGFRGYFCYQVFHGGYCYYTDAN